MSSLKELAARRCRPMKGAENRLDAPQIGAFLALLPGWETAADGKSIVRDFRFENYHQTMAFVNALAWIAHQEDHHPDLGVHYNHCTVHFSTHDVGGLSENDFICAAKASALLSVDEV